MVPKKDDRAWMLSAACDFGAQLISRNPYIEVLAVSGSLSNREYSHFEDVDFFVITERGRLWECFTNCIISAYLYELSHGLPRKFFCFNYLIDGSRVAEYLDLGTAPNVREFGNLIVLKGKERYREISIELLGREPARHEGGTGRSLDEVEPRTPRFDLLTPLVKRAARLFEWRRKASSGSPLIYSDEYVIRSHRLRGRRGRG